MSDLDTLINRLNMGANMSPQQMCEELKRLKQPEQKETWMEGPSHREMFKEIMTEGPREGQALTERAPVGRYPGRVNVSGRTPSATQGPRTEVDRERARRFGFPPARLMILTDGSENAHKAIEAALHYRRRNDNLFFVTAVQLGADKQTNIELTNKAKSVMDHCKEIIHERELGRWETAILPTTNPQQAIVDYAYNNNIDLCFIGTRGIDCGTGDFHPDSFSKFVLHNSHCSVMLIR